MNDRPNTPITYENSGVNITAGNDFSKHIAASSKKLLNRNVLQGIGGFASLYKLDLKKTPNPVLVSATDGVGTKLQVAHLMQKHDTIGIDLVAMCVNDLIVCGADPLYFLDYFATGHLSPEISKEIIKGILTGCEQSDIPLIGGETAEMPSMYAGDDYDLAGFSVGVVDEQRIIDGSKAEAGDLLIGIPSSGVHSNGFSLVRKVFFDKEKMTVETQLDSLGGKTLGEEILTPTTIYVRLIKQIKEILLPKALSHITGGGLLENLPRVLPDHLSCHISRSSWEIPAIFQEIKERAHIDDNELLRVFNCGVGMVIVINPDELTSLKDLFNKLNQPFYQLGELSSKQENDKEGVIFHD